MNTDFRVSVEFFSHHKTRRLRKLTGDAGVICLMMLWAYAAKHRPDGRLSGMDSVDVELAVDWQGDDGSFVNALLDTRFLDQDEQGLSLHDWEENNPWVADAKARSEKAKNAAAKRWNKNGNAKPVQEGCSSNAQAVKEDEVSNASTGNEHDSSNAPSPSPSPTPSYSGVVRARAIEEETPGSVCDEEEALHPPSAREATKIIQAFDKARADAFGPEMARPWPNQMDLPTAQRWLKEGVDLETCVFIFATTCKAKAEQGEPPPNTLKYFEQAILATIAQKSKPMEASHGREQTQPGNDQGLVERLRAKAHERNAVLGLAYGPEPDAPPVLSAVPGKDR